MNEWLKLLLQSDHPFAPGPDGWNSVPTNIDHGMVFVPKGTHPAMNDKNIIMPDDVPWPSRQLPNQDRNDVGALGRLMGPG